MPTVTILRFMQHIVGKYNNNNVNVHIAACRLLYYLCIVVFFVRIRIDTTSKRAVFRSRGLFCLSAYPGNLQLNLEQLDNFLTY